MTMCATNWLLLEVNLQNQGSSYLV